MQALLGLAFFSVLLTTGASLQCDQCQATSKTCSNKVNCTSEMDICMSKLTETKTGSVTVYSIIKDCNTKTFCAQEKEKAKTQSSEGSVITIECSKAPPSAGSLLLALSGLLLLKILV